MAVLEGVMVTPLAYAELPTLLGRKRLRLGGRKGQHGENSTNSAKRIKKKKKLSREAGISPASRARVSTKQNVDR